MAVPDEFQATHSVSLLFAAGNPPSSLAHSFLVSTFNSMSTRHYTASWWCYTRKTSPFSHQHAHHVRIRPLSSISLSLFLSLWVSSCFPISYRQIDRYLIQYYLANRNIGSDILSAQSKQVVYSITLSSSFFFFVEFGHTTEVRSVLSGFQALED